MLNRDVTCSTLVRFVHLQKQPRVMLLKKATLLHSNFIEITLQHGCSPENLLHIFGTPFYKNTSGELLVYIAGHANFGKRLLN